MVPKRYQAVTLFIVVVAAATFAWQVRDAWSLERLARNESALRASVEQHPVMALLGAFCVYVAITGLSLPGAGVMSLTYGWLFGFWRAVVLLSFAATAGAGVAFLTSRYLVGQYVQQRYAERLASMNRWLDSEGALYLFWLRLIPAIPFFVINLVAGLTRMRLWTFLWVSQIGMLPGTCLFAYAGSRLPTLEQIATQGAASLLRPGVVLAFVMLGAAPLAFRSVYRRWATRRRL